MRLPFFLAMLLTMAVLGVAYGQTSQTGTQYCYTTFTGHVKHEYCTFTPLTVAAPAVTVQAPAVTVQPRIEVQQPKPAEAPKKVRD